MKVVLFDGVCNLCNTTITYIIKRDIENKFKFASLQSKYANEKTKNRFVNELSTIVLIDDEKEYVKSTAVLRIFKELKGYKWVRILLFVPVPIRDFFYKLVASNRYTLFGKRKSCMMPSKELNEKFIN
ncbi:thiol-disulfide oxidoreductase DCC family protein [Tenacibaculum xiamenense]|uniref:thiol-disulfide oxidoreductase DCC family protein n=1 Tax=Tenacibaculum xiamenense TaxID=1261553 RepID=UPI003892D6AA